MFAFANDTFSSIFNYLSQITHLHIQFLMMVGTEDCMIQFFNARMFLELLKNEVYNNE